MPMSAHIRYTSTAPQSVNAVNWTHVYMTFLTQNQLWN
jgi:hypothetical protein